MAARTRAASGATAHDDVGLEDGDLLPKARRSPPLARTRAASGATAHDDVGLEDGDLLPKARRSPPLGPLAALFYGSTSLLIIACNKLSLTSFGFGSSNVLALFQFIVTCFALALLALLGAIDLERPSLAVATVALPLTVLFLGDVLSGLSATGSISLPMFTVLRRFSIPMTLALEGFVGQSAPSRLVVASVWGMVFGAVVAAADDLAFEPKAYGVILFNDLLTAARGVYVKAALAPASPSASAEKRPKQLSKLSLLFYNALFSTILLLPYVLANGELKAAQKFLEKAPASARAAVALSAGLGPVLQYSIFLCTQHNSALTTTVIGALKNVATAYFGMFIGGDYLHSHLNFAGITLSCAASLVYSYATFGFAAQPPQPTPQHSR
ncbi:hypothetical protein M885DRAFT_617598 [Pelagophyceae sp. CCMP2097]|nr:hypothetical protein M885DRAFT_617598 [Pelagophyceae sp. CCMP2097]